MDRITDMFETQKEGVHRACLEHKESQERELRYVRTY